LQFIAGFSTGPREVWSALAPTDRFKVRKQELNTVADVAVINVGVLY